MRQIRPDQQVVNLGCPGETSDTMINGGCLWTTDVGPTLRVDYSGSQLDAAVAFLRAHRGKVSPITLSIGTADLLFADDCNLDPACIASNHVLAHFHKNLNRILTTLQGAAPDAEIIVLQPYDAFAEDLPSNIQVWEQLNRIIGQVAAEEGELADMPGAVERGEGVDDAGGMLAAKVIYIPPTAGMRCVAGSSFGRRAMNACSSITTELRPAWLWVCRPAGPALSS
jgi:hypothetical protein